MSATAVAVPQPLRALQHANTVRLAGLAVKRDVKTGALSLAQALADERAGSLTVMDLLVAQPRWGVSRASLVLQCLRISEIRRVRELTDRQRRVIAQAAR